MRELALGMTGEDVGRWERFLIREGQLDQDAATGLFGPKLAEATRRFQGAAGLEATGRADAATLAAALHKGFLDSGLDAPKAPATVPPSKKTDWTILLPVIVAVVAGLIAATGSIWSEQEKLRSSVVLRAIQTDDVSRAANNLRWFHSIGMIRLTQEQLKQLESQPGRTPVLPAASAGDPIAGAGGAQAAGPTAPTGMEVLVQFAGTLQRDDVRDMMLALRTQGWRVPGASSGGQRTPAAANQNEVRYGPESDRPAAAALAKAVNEAKLVPATVVPRHVPIVRPGTLEVWIGN